MIKKINNNNYHYYAYGMNILSEIPIICFTQSESNNKIDITLKRGHVPDNLEYIERKGAFYQSNENEFLLRIPNLAKIYITEGKNVIIDAESDIDIKELSAFISGRVFAVLFHQRKLNPFHGSAVNYKNKTILFLGISGSGKSTIAATIIKKGGTLIADDVAQIFFNNNKIYIQPSYPYIKLWEDIIKSLKIEPKDLKPVRNGIKKYYWKACSFSKKPMQLDCIIILNTDNKEDIVFEKISGIQKFKLLKKHTSIFENVKYSDLISYQFQICSKVAKSIPIYMITRPSEGLSINKIIKKIEQNI